MIKNLWMLLLQELTLGLVLSILAHEIGHHVNGHTLGEKETTLSESRQMELEADEYSGLYMFKLGASLSQAQEAIRLILYKC